MRIARSCMAEGRRMAGWVVEFLTDDTLHGPFPAKSVADWWAEKEAKRRRTASDFNAWMVHPLYEIHWPEEDEGTRHGHPDKG